MFDGAIFINDVASVFKWWKFFCLRFLTMVLGLGPHMFPLEYLILNSTHPRETS